jgi:hypothetical protein
MFPDPPLISYAAVHLSNSMTTMQSQSCDAAHSVEFPPWSIMGILRMVEGPMTDDGRATFSVVVTTDCASDADLRLANVRRKRPSIARRAAYYCASLHM